MVAFHRSREIGRLKSERSSNMLCWNWETKYFTNIPMTVRV